MILEDIKKNKAVFAFLSVFTVVLLTLFLVRLTHGVGTTDEAFYCITGYRLLKGGVPFGDMWETIATTSYFMLPFLLVRSIFVSNADGIELYLRVCFFLLNFITVFCICLYAGKTIKKSYAYLLGLLFLVYAPYRIYNFSYNNLANTFVMITIAMLVLGRESGKKRFFFVTGVTMACAILSYPTHAYLCGILTIFIFISEIMKKRIANPFIYALGGISVALPIVIHIVSNTGFDTMIKNIGTAVNTDSAHNVFLISFLKNLVDSFIFLLEPFVQDGPAFGLIYAAMVILAVIKKTRKYVKLIIPAYLFLCGVFTLNSFFFDAIERMFLIHVVILIPIIVLISNDKKTMLKKVALEWGLAFIHYHIIAFTSGGRAYQAVHALIVASVVTVKLYCETLDDEDMGRFKNGFVYATIIYLIGFEMMAYFGYSFNEHQFPKLTARVDIGVFKGLYTTPDRKQYIEDLERALDKASDPGESVLVLYHNCAIYLMLGDMTTKTPSTWGCYDYTLYEVDNEQLFMDYLSIEENIPENIIVVDEPDDFDYGDKVKYYVYWYPALNDFVVNNYTFVGDFEEGMSDSIKKFELNR
ncbi:MAG: glycosyltransferase family 39 protein [Saccharofermentans sp.]|nr:glycosyltransferase family 39 protein [Saccharofermentans sp.]